MSDRLLLKGFEVEMYTGRPDGTVVGCAAEAVAALAGFVTEPDNRNLEHITAPDASYRRQLELLLEPRRRLRAWLAPHGLTLLPGSTLSLGDSHRFERSDPSNTYHDTIEQTYGTRVVTASVHINLGISDMAHLFAGLRLMRCEAALLLAVTAFAELRLHQLQAEPERHDPLLASRCSLAALADLADANDRAAARSSLTSTLCDWRNGEPIEARAWIGRELEGMAPLASELGLSEVLAPLAALLDTGNQAMRWRQRQRQGESIAAIISSEAAAMQAQEDRLEAWLVTDASCALGS